jgi:hypothetical protein
VTTTSGLLPGSNARVYRDGAPGEGVHEATVGVPQDRPLELRNLQPGTYAIQDEAGNVELFTVDAFAESAWVPVQGAAPVALGADADASDPKTGKLLEDRGHAPKSELAARPAVVDPDTVRVPGAPGSAHIGEPPAREEAKAQPNSPTGKRPHPKRTEPKPDASERSAGKQAQKAADAGASEIKAPEADPVPEPESKPQRARRPRSKAAHADKPKPQSAKQAKS